MTDERKPSEAGAAVTPEQLEAIGKSMASAAQDLANLVGPVVAGRMLLGLAGTFMATHSTPWATAAELGKLSRWLAKKAPRLQ